VLVVKEEKAFVAVILADRFSAFWVANGFTSVSIRTQPYVLCLIILLFSLKSIIMWIGFRTLWLEILGAEHFLLIDCYYL
jgi:hypothetical protein